MLVTHKHIYTHAYTDTHAQAFTQAHTHAHAFSLALESQTLASSENVWPSFSEGKR